MLETCLFLLGASMDIVLVITKTTLKLSFGQFKNIQIHEIGRLIIGKESWPTFIKRLNLSI